MALQGFFKQHRPRGFTYKPRYYDPGKEEWEQRRAAMGLESPYTKDNDVRSSPAGGSEGISDGGEPTAGRPQAVYRSRIVRGSMRGYFTKNRERLQRQSMIRLIVILLILLFVVYIYLRY